VQHDDAAPEVNKAEQTALQVGLSSFLLIIELE
jgi:hypothetical protein